MCCLASQGYPSPSFKSNISPSGWILGSGLVPLKIYSIWGGLRCGLLFGSCGWILGSGFVSLRIYSIWGGLRGGLLLGSCGFRRCFYENLQHLRWAPVWALVGSSDVSMRIYSIWGGLRCGLLWVPATFLWEFTAFCVLRKPARVGGLALYKRIFGLKCWSGQCSGRAKWCQFS